MEKDAGDMFDDAHLHVCIVKIDQLLYEGQTLSKCDTVLYKLFTIRTCIHHIAKA